VKKLKVALVVPGGVDRSGEYRVIPALVALIERLARVVDLRVFALAQEPQPGSWTLAGARIHNIGDRARTLRAIAAICHEHRAGAFDVVHSMWAGAVGFVSVASARLMRRPCLVHVAGGELAALHDIGYGGCLHWWGRARERFVMRGATHVSAASMPIIEQIATLGVRASRIPLGVDRERWPVAAPRRRDPAMTARLVHVASLNRVKDQSILLHAMRLLIGEGTKLHLDIVGEDTLGGRMQALARDLELLPFVSFHGFQTQVGLRPIVESAHVHIVSSLHEAGPLAMLEAAIVGVPTAGTAVGHVREWMPDAALGANTGDPAGLAAAIGALVNDEDLRLRVAREAQTRAVAMDADFTAVRFLEVYGSMSNAAQTDNMV
jgi:glycosyltransferase involved in cell wall biosynthesis